MKNTTFSKVHRAFSWFIDHRAILIALIALATLGMGYMASKVEVKTIFSDLLPKTHPYVKVNQQFKSTFGGSNLVTIMVENQKGEIFDLKVLEAVQKLTVGMQQVNGIDTYQIISLASKKIKEIRASTEGVESKPIMWPRLPEGPEQMAKLRAAVLNNPLVYGPYVSLDLKATLITADFRDGEIDYTKAFNEIMAQIEEVKKGADGVTIRVVGEPVLYLLTVHHPAGGHPHLAWYVFAFGCGRDQRHLGTGCGKDHGFPPGSARDRGGFLDHSTGRF